MNGQHYNLKFTEPEVNLLWGALNSCSFVGKDAPLLLGLMAKVQQAAQNPVVDQPVSTTEPNKVETEKNQTAEAPSAPATK